VKQDSDALAKLQQKLGDPHVVSIKGAISPHAAGWVEEGPGCRIYRVTGRAFKSWFGDSERRQLISTLKSNGHLKPSRRGGSQGTNDTKQIRFPAAMGGRQRGYELTFPTANSGT
jgi:hypothetical protein